MTATTSDIVCNYFLNQRGTFLSQGVNVWTTISKFFLFWQPFYCFFPSLVKKFNFLPAFNCTTWQLQLYHQWYAYHSLRKVVVDRLLLVQTRLIALECIDRLLDSLDKMMILDEVLPFLTDIQCSDVDIIMCIVCESSVFNSRTSLLRRSIRLS